MLASVRTIVITAALLSVAAASLLAQKWRWNCKKLESRILELEADLRSSLELRAAERKGRIKAQQALRKSLVTKDASDGANATYPMVPIGFIHSCFSTRNGTPRQPLIVPLARACLVLSPGGVPAAAFEGLTEYSHCWLLYIFHANTDLPHIWEQPTHKDFKAKVRVPRLDGGKLGVYATRTPHRPCPIGLTVAKVEGVFGRMLLISGADLVDGTPVLDVKPYLPYCDSVADAIAPSWVKEGGDSDDPIALASVEFSVAFEEELPRCWGTLGKHSMYSSPDELKKLIEQVLSRDIRSLRQRKNPHTSLLVSSDNDPMLGNHSVDDGEDDNASNADQILQHNSDKPKNEHVNSVYPEEGTQLVMYRLELECFIIKYTVDNGHVIVQGVEVSESRSNAAHECNYSIWAKCYTV